MKNLKIKNKILKQKENKFIKKMFRNQKNLKKKNNKKILG